MRVNLPGSVRTPISLLGVAIATAMAVVFIALLALELGGVLRNPYLGLLLFIAVPAVFLFGLLLIPLGTWRRRRHLAAGRAPEDWPVVDLRVPRTRVVIATVAALTVVNVLIFSLAGYGAIHHMESAEFCGATCHTTMEPELAYPGRATHASPACRATSDRAPKRSCNPESTALGSCGCSSPTTSPRRCRPGSAPCSRRARRARPAIGPGSSTATRSRRIREYADDERSTETVTTVQLHVGGGTPERGSGIHWHMNIGNRIEYIATDAPRQVIPWVKLTDRDGTVTEFTLPGTHTGAVGRG